VAPETVEERIPAARTASSPEPQPESEAEAEETGGAEEAGAEAVEAGGAGEAEEAGGAGGAEAAFGTAHQEVCGGKIIMEKYTSYVAAPSLQKSMQGVSLTLREKKRSHDLR
jgi:hypothetical protein